VCWVCFVPGLFFFAELCTSVGWTVKVLAHMRQSEIQQAETTGALKMTDMKMQDMFQVSG